MKKLLIFVGLCLLLVGCSSNEPGGENAIFSLEYDDVIVDNDDFTITLVSLEKSFDFSGNKHVEIGLDVDNKSDFPIGVNALDVSIDGSLLDPAFLGNEEVEANSSKTVMIDVKESDSVSIPAVEIDVEGILEVYNADTLDNLEEYAFDIDLQ